MKEKIRKENIQLEAFNDLVEVRVEGKLTRESYQLFVPFLEEVIEREGKIRVLFEMVDFHGWTAGALWDDLKFDLKHFRDIERLAIVGEKKWQKGMAVFCKPFTTAKVKAFDVSELEEARSWLRVESPAKS